MRCLVSLDRNVKGRASVLRSKIGNVHFSCVFVRKGQLDVRELISLCPLLLPASSSFTRCHPPLHEFADLNHLAQGDQEKVQRCKHFLISYLREVRASESANGFRQDVDTALLKLYAEAGHEGLLELLDSDNSCLLTDSTPWLEKHHRSEVFT